MPPACHDQEQLGYGCIGWWPLARRACNQTSFNHGCMWANVSANEPRQQHQEASQTCSIGRGLGTCHLCNANISESPFRGGWPGLFKSTCSISPAAIGSINLTQHITHESMQLGVVHTCNHGSYIHQSCAPQSACCIHGVVCTIT